MNLRITRSGPYQVDPEGGGAIGKVDFEASGCRGSLGYVVDPIEGVVIKHLELDAGRLSSATLRKVPFGAIRDYLRSSFIARPHLLPYHAPSELRLDRRNPTDGERAAVMEGYKRWLRLAGRLTEAPLKRGRGVSKENHDRYREIATMYLVFLPIHGQKVIKGMAEAMNEPRNTVSTWVRRARELGWLTTSSPGRAGGTAGRKLIDWEKQHGKEKPQ